MEGLDEFFSGMKLGETVLIEHYSNSYPELFLYLLSKFAKRKGMRILVDDILDTYPQFVARLKLMNLPLPETFTIKIGGGRLEEGTVLGRLELDKYSIPLGHYSKTTSKFQESNGPYLNPVVGLDRVPLLMNNREKLSLVSTISSFIGNEKRIAFYLVNTDVLRNSSPEFIPLLEEISTTVGEFRLEGDELVLEVTKAANPDLLGRIYKIKINDIFED